MDLESVVILVQIKLNPGVQGCGQTWDPARPGGVSERGVGADGGGRALWRAGTGLGMIWECRAAGARCWVVRGGGRKRLGFGSFRAANAGLSARIYRLAAKPQSSVNCRSCEMYIAQERSKSMGSCIGECVQIIGCTDAMRLIVGKNVGGVRNSSSSN